MKALLITILLMFSSCLWGQINPYEYQNTNRLELKGKQAYPNSISAVIQTSNWGPGLRYEHRFKRSLGFYTQGTYGDYVEASYGIKDELSISAGVMIDGFEEYDDWFPCVTFGMSYNTYTYYDLIEIPDNHADDMFSFELGTSGQIGRVCIFAMTDLCKWKLSVGVGYCF